MRAKTCVFALTIVLVLVACGGPATTQPPPAVEPSSVPPTATPRAEPTEEPTDLPTEEPAREEPPTESPAEEPTAAPPTSAGGEALLEERCTVCHGVDRVTRARKNREAWEQTVRRMIGLGAELNDEETVVLVDYLAETYGQ